MHNQNQVVPPVTPAPDGEVALAPKVAAAVPAPAAGRNKPRKLEQVVTHAKSIKVTLVVNDFGQHLEYDTTGFSAVPFAVETGTGRLKMTVSAKGFRKTQAAYKANNGNVAVLIVGELNLDKREILSAGISAQIRTPKVVEVDAPTVATSAETLATVAVQEIATVQTSLATVATASQIPLQAQPVPAAVLASEAPVAVGATPVSVEQVPVIVRKKIRSFTLPSGSPTSAS